jgi:hypothetical protein
LGFVAWDQSKESQVIHLEDLDRFGVESRIATEGQSVSIFGDAGIAAQDYLAYGMMGATHSEGGAGLESTSATLQFTEEDYYEEGFDESQHLFLMLLGPEVLGNGFDTMTFTVERRGRYAGDGWLELMNFEFDNVADASAFFDGTLLDIGAYSEYDTAVFRYRMETDLLAFSDGFAFDVLTMNSTMVPVPPAVWLFGSGLALLGWRRRKALH